MKKLIITLIPLALLSACRTQKTAERIVETRTELKEIVRDTTIYVPADSAQAIALLQCDSMGNVLIKQLTELQGKQRAKASLQLKNNAIIADCHCDSTAIYAKLHDRYEKTTASTNETQIKYIEKQLSWWQKTLMVVGSIALFVLIAPMIMVVCRR